MISNILGRVSPYWVWIKLGLAVAVFVAWSWFIYGVGVNSERVDHLKTKNEYALKEIENKQAELNEVVRIVDEFNKGLERFNQKETKVKSVAKEIHTETVREIEKPIYKQCVISTEYFEFLNKKIDELNGVQ